MAQGLSVFVAISMLFQAAWGSAIGPLGVVGGNGINIEQANYMALLYTLPGAPCGGVIIDERFILTTSTCCIGTTKDLYAFVGTNRKDQLGKAVSIEKMIKYDEELRPSLCLVKLQEKLEFNAQVNKIKLDDGRVILDRYTQATLTAFGAGSKNDVSPRQLRQGTIRINDSDYCKEEMKRLNYKLFCAGDEKQNGCYGDVGGALVAENTLVGVLTTVPHDCQYQPSRFARISAFGDWIRKNTANN